MIIPFPYIQNNCYLKVIVRLLLCNSCRFALKMVLQTSLHIAERYDTYTHTHKEIIHINYPTYFLSITQHVHNKICSHNVQINVNNKI